MTKPRGKGKPFPEEGEDPRRLHRRQDEQVNEFAREMKKCLLLRDRDRSGMTIGALRLRSGDLVQEAAELH